MKKGIRPKYDALASNFSKDVIFNFYIVENHSFNDCVKEFNTTPTVLRQYLKDNDINKKYKLERFKSMYSVEDVVNFYIVNNNSFDSCVNYFNTTPRVFNEFLKLNNIVKPRQLVKELADKTKLEKYGDVNYNNREKSKETCLIKYGATSPLACRSIWEKTYKSTKDKYGGTGFQLFPPEKLKLTATEAAKKVWNNCLLIDGYRDHMKNSEYVTKKSNNTFNTSKYEEEYYTYLVSLYGEEDVERQHKDDLYPYACDFYIKSLKLYIELNLHWTHGGHPLDKTNEDDIKKLDEWKEKAKTSKFYENAIHTWTIRDVEKLNKLINNNLNYDLIYKL